MNQGVGNVTSFMRLFKQRLVDMFIQEWSAAVRDRDRYETYRSFKYVFASELYLTDIDLYCFRVAMTQLRLGVLPINNNMFRYSDSPTSRNCPFCVNTVEDEHHFLFVCPQFTDLRSKYLVCLASTLTVSTVLSWKDSIRCSSISKFVFLANKRRSMCVDAYIEYL
jgi:hypothetical protein